MTSQFDWSILLQIPLVAAFIWYSIQMQKSYQDNVTKIQDRNQASMDKRDEAYLGALNKISDKMDQNTRALEKAMDCIHDRK